MTLNPDEKEVLESFERGEWKPVDDGDEVARMLELVRHQLRADVRANFDALIRGEERSPDATSGKRLAQRSRHRAVRIDPRSPEPRARASPGSAGHARPCSREPGGSQHS